MGGRGSVIVNLRGGNEGLARTHPPCRRIHRWTAFSYECLEPNLAVYDKVYKNMGLGNGIFSWCRRSQQKEKK